MYCLPDNILPFIVLISPDVVPFVPVVVGADIYCATPSISETSFDGSVAVTLWLLTASHRFFTCEPFFTPS